jgi:hypothetical protein
VSVGFGLAMFESPFSGRVNQWRLSLQGEGQRQLYRCRQRPAPLARDCLFVCLFVWQSTSSASASISKTMLGSCVHSVLVQ